MSELTLPNVAQSNTVKPFDHCSQVNTKWKYILFLVQFLVQMNKQPPACTHARRCGLLHRGRSRHERSPGANPVIFEKAYLL